MNLEESWARTKDLLSRAAEELRPRVDLHAFDEFLAHNELELAADVLAEHGDERGDVPERFWDALAAAYESMKLAARAARCQLRSCGRTDIASRPTAKRVLVIDGSRFGDLEGFYDEVSAQLIPGADWGRNLDAFNDILRGGFGTPEGGFVLRWVHSQTSREVLGHPETARWLEKKKVRGHPSNVPSVEDDLRRAWAGEGPTLFDILLAIIRAHGRGGAEQEDGVELELA